MTPRARQYGVLSEDGVTYRTGTWSYGVWYPASLWRTARECALLQREEPQAKVVRIR